MNQFLISAHNYTAENHSSWVRLGTPIHMQEPVIFKSVANAIILKILRSPL